MADALGTPPGPSQPLAATPEVAGPGAGRLGRRLLLVLAVLLVAGSTFGFFWHERDDALVQAAEVSERRVRRLVLDLRTALEFALAAQQRVLAALDARPPGASVAQALAAVDEELEPLLQRSALPFTLRALDAQGQPLAAGASASGAARSAGPAVPVAPATTRWRVEVPTGDASSRVLPLVRRAPDNPHGVAAFVVEFEHAAVQRLLDAERVAPGGGSALFRIEGDGTTTLLARVPLAHGDIGRRVRGPLAFELTRSPSGTARAVAAIDGVDRLFAYRRLDGDAGDLVVAYSFAVDAVLAGWRTQLPWAALSALLVSAALVAGARRLERSLDAQARQRLELQRSEAHFRTLAQNLPDVVVRLDREGRHLYANPAVQVATGLPPEAFIGRTNAELGMPAENVATWTAALRRALDSGSVERLEFTYPGPQGGRRWESLIAPERPGSARAPTALVISRDVTERQRSEEAVRRLAAELEQRVAERTAQLALSEARYRTIFETAPVAIIEEDWTGVQRVLRALRDAGVTDLADHLAAHPEVVRQCLRAVAVQRINRTAQQMHDIGRLSPAVRSLEPFFPSPEHLAQFSGELEAMWDGRRLFTAKRALPSLAGRPLQLMLTMSLPGLDDADGLALVSLVDITELDRLNAELERSLARLRRANQELETFTYTVSHDLKAPLRGIEGYSRLLTVDHATRLEAEGREFVERIRQSARHMGLLIDDLLAYSRLERRNLTLARLPLAPLVDGVLAGFRQEFEAGGVELAVRVDPGLQVLVDGQGLTMALRNLVDNALKFSRASQPPCIAVEASPSASGVALTVRDNGIGFDMRHAGRIFAVFQRLHRADDFPGTGIGLAIVRKAMERIGGRVSVDSRPGAGAAFTLELPTEARR